MITHGKMEIMHTRNMNTSVFRPDAVIGIIGNKVHLHITTQDIMAMSASCFVMQKTIYKTTVNKSSNYLSQQHIIQEIMWWPFLHLVQN